MEFERRKPCAKVMNLAPLVDVVFLLLLFFMLTSQFIKESAIKITLPESKAAETAADNEPKTVTITEKGLIYFMDKAVKLEDLQKAIIESHEKDFIRIKADSDVSLGLMVKVIDEVKLAGIKQFSIVTQQKAEK